MKRNYDFSKGAVIKGKLKSKEQVDEALRGQKTLTSIRLDNSIIEVAKKKAEEAGIGYLTWINMKLKKAVLEEDDLEGRVKKLEKTVF
jgi:predicted DNA binding CopG/RHH family protein